MAGNLGARVYFVAVGALRHTTQPSLLVARRQFATATATGPRWEKIEITGNATGMKTTTKAKNHEIVTDEPSKLGGTDSAATPLQTLLASLIGCEHATAMFLAKKRRVEIKSIEFSAEAEYDLRSFMGVEGVPARFQRLKLRGTVDSP
eukprot:Opistho-2@22438